MKKCDFFYRGHSFPTHTQTFTSGQAQMYNHWYEPQGKPWTLIPVQAPGNLPLMTSPPVPLPDLRFRGEPGDGVKGAGSLPKPGETQCASHPQSIRLQIG